MFVPPQPVPVRSRRQVGATSLARAKDALACRRSATPDRISKTAPVGPAARARPMPAWSLPAIPAPALAFSARRHGAEKLSKSGHRIRQQAVCISVGSTRLLAQPPIGSPMHAPRLLRKRFQRVVAPAEPHLDLLRSAHCPFYGNLLLARVHQPQAVPAGEQASSRPVA